MVDNTGEMVDNPTPLIYNTKNWLFISKILNVQSGTHTVVHFQRASPKFFQEIIRYIYEVAPKLNKIYFTGRELDNVSEEASALPIIPLNLMDVSILGTDISGESNYLLSFI